MAYSFFFFFKQCFFLPREVFSFPYMFSKGKEGKQVQTVSEVSEGTGPALGLLRTEPGCHHPGLSGLSVNNLEHTLQGTRVFHIHSPDKTEGN